MSQLSGPEAHARPLLSRGGMATGRRAPGAQEHPGSWRFPAARWARSSPCAALPLRGFRTTSQLLLLTGARLFALTAAFVRKLAERATAVQAKGASNNLPIFSPQTGIAVPLSQAPVVAYADGSVGQGLAIRSLSGSVVAPFDATVVAVYPVNHAIVLRHVGGVEVLIHIAVGAETLDGEHFTPKVGCDQKVAAGSLLVEFDHAAIKDAGYDAVTSVIVLNGDQYPRVVPLASGSISQGEALFMAIAVENSAGARRLLKHRGPGR